jgi:hypothetical protein
MKKSILTLMFLFVASQAFASHDGDHGKNGKGHVPVPVTAGDHPDNGVKPDQKDRSAGAAPTQADVDILPKKTSVTSHGLNDEPPIEGTTVEQPK